LQRAHNKCILNGLVHSRRRFNVFGDAKFLILPKSNRICPNLNHFCPYFAQIYPNFAQKFFREYSCIPSSYGIGLVSSLHAAAGAIGL